VACAPCARASYQGARPGSASPRGQRGATSTSAVTSARCQQLLSSSLDRGATRRMQRLGSARTSIAMFVAATHEAVERAQRRATVRKQDKGRRNSRKPLRLLANLMESPGQGGGFLRRRGTAHDLPARGLELAHAQRESRHLAAITGAPRTTRACDREVRTHLRSPRSGPDSLPDRRADSRNACTWSRPSRFPLRRSGRRHP
jgi:hypothetical protein